MNSQKIICPFDKGIISRISGRSIGLRLANFDIIPESVGYLQDRGNDLFCIIYESKESLDCLNLREENKDTPIAIFAQSVGKYRNLSANINSLRNANIRVFLPYSKENTLGSRFLASLGIHNYLILDSDNFDWEELADLMTYSILSTFPHASIGPFINVADKFDSSSYTEWDYDYFESSASFIHIDSNGNIALTNADLLSNNYLIAGFKEINSDTKFAVPEDQNDKLKNFFLENHPCTLCTGWRICQGGFSKQICGNNSGCSMFFSEFISVCQSYKQMKENRKTPNLIWQL